MIAKRKNMSIKLTRVTLVFACILCLVGTEKVYSGTKENGKGWSWGGGAETVSPGYSGTGWLSMNNTDESGAVIGGNVSYGMNIPSGDGPIIEPSYAWSEHYGWISFNASDLQGCPSGPCSVRREGRLLKGWARILSVRDAAVSGNAGGWSGWIKLSPDATDTVNGYGVDVAKMVGSVSRCGDGGNYSTCTFAWSDELGWIDLSRTKVTLVGNLNGSWLWGASENPDRGVQTALSGNETGVGWISMNGADCDTDINGFVDTACGGDNVATPAVSYGVRIPASDGPVTGYAWWGYGQSAGDGDWLDFNPEDHCQTAPVTAGDTDRYQAASCDLPLGSQDAPGVRREGDRLVGWARIVGVATNTVTSNAGGWEGWVSLSGDNYGVTIRPDQTLSGYAWQGETNGAVQGGLGWITFDRARIAVPATLKVCRDGCNSGIRVTAAGFTMLETEPARAYRACFNAVTDCNAAGPADGDVTADTDWQANNLPADALSLSPNGATPRTIAPNDIAGVSSKMEQVDVTRGSETLSFPVTVGCVATGDWTDANGRVIDRDYLLNVCSSDGPVTGHNDSCGSATHDFPSLKNCNKVKFWREVAPN